MADVRALLKAKRQEARVTHPLALYSSSGQLRCSACGTIVKHASAWEGHLGSKAHRTTVARLREEERVRVEKQEQERRVIALGKRKSPEQDDEDQEMQEPESKKSKPNAAGTFPADFFSDPSRAPPVMDVDEDASRTEPPVASDGVGGALDDEWSRFQREVINAPDFQDTYENATVFAEPVMAPEVPEGFPSQQQDDVVEEAVDEEAKRKQKDMDERELIMDRLLEEERAQEEADMKVTVMKNKVEALKRKREAAKALKAKS